jgi:hypothetical protein
MTPTEYAQNLIARGYAEIQEYKGRDYTLKPGDRVKKAAQRFGYESGTGSVERVFIKENSAWSQTYRADDVELIVKNDDGTYSYVAQYHVEKVGA